jgi:hypothetical protein
LPFTELKLQEHKGGPLDVAEQGTFGERYGFFRSRFALARFSLQAPSPFESSVKAFSEGEKEALLCGKKEKTS